MISKVEESGNRTKTTTYCYDNNGNQYSSSVDWLETADYIPSGLDLAILGTNDDSSLGEINEFNSQNQIVVTYTGENTIQFSYNGDGIRVGKSVNGSIEKYLYDTGNHVVLEVDADGEQAAENIYGIYNVSRIIGNNSYSYLHNGHGDVTALLDSDENAVNRYTYDAFGVILTSTETVENPFTYAGYWYDSETGLYYLMARYYNPVNGRFLSEDPARDGYNWYVYCDNNPIIYIDPNGEWLHLAIGAVVGAAISGISSAIYQYAKYDKVDFGKTAIAVVGGAISGTLAATGAGLVVQIAGNAAISATQSIAEQTYNISKGESQEYDLIEIGWSASIGAIAGAVGGSANVSGIKSLSNQTIKRIGNAIRYHINNGRTKQISKALTYYYKSVSTLMWREIIKGIVKAGGVDAANKIISETELAKNVKNELRGLAYDY